jgi:hypothetical protein
MQVSKGVTVDYKEGKIVAEIEVAALIVPKLDELKAKIESGEIDPIKGTSLDAVAMIGAIDFIKAEITK